LASALAAAQLLAPRLLPGAEGDEIALLRTLVPAATVVAAKRKADGAADAARALAAAGPGGVVVVDDAFSHRRLERDLDVVLLDAARPLGNGHLLPYGPLREPPTALARAGALVLARADRLSVVERERTHAALARLAPGVPQAAGRLAPAGLVRGDDGAPATLPGGAAVVCVSGLARPAELGRSARALGLTVVAERAFADHHRFSDGEWREALAVAERNGARLLVSAKDAARLDRAQRAQAVVLEVEWEWIGAGGSAVEAAIDRAAGKGRP
jgi:tetraacyldisaccharide 4'-kinase